MNKVINSNSDGLLLQTTSIKTIDTGLTIYDILKNSKTRRTGKGIITMHIKMKLDQYTNIKIFRKYDDTVMIEYACETGFKCVALYGENNKKSNIVMMFQVEDAFYLADSSKLDKDGFCRLRIATENDYKSYINSYPLGKSIEKNIIIYSMDERFKSTMKNLNEKELMRTALCWLE